MAIVHNKIIPISQPVLGARRRCPRGYEWNQQGNFCVQTSGGGSARFAKLPPALYGAAVPATPATGTNNGNELTLDPTGTKTETGSFDIMQFLSDNALWLGIGAAGIIAIILLSKKRR